MGKKNAQNVFQLNSFIAFPCTSVLVSTVQLSVPYFQHQRFSLIQSLLITKMKYSNKPDSHNCFFSYMLNFYQA